MSNISEPPTVNKYPYQIPTSVTKASRQELDNQLLTVRKFEIGQNSHHALVQPETGLPSDLAGYYFVASALSAEGSQVINGDGMIYRVGFADGKATLKTRIAKTPCYYVDQITQRQPETYPQAYRFQDAGPSRMSTKLGNRNQLNTAFLKTRDRLLLTFDAGIPWVIDPSSMELIEPVGRMDNWLTLTSPFASLAPSTQDSILPPHSNPAHPVCDLHRPEDDFPKCPHEQFESLPNDHFLTLNYSTGYKGKFRKNFDLVLGWIEKNTIDRARNRARANRIYGFTDLIRYSFDSQKLERWQLVMPDWDEKNPDDKKIVIGEQSIHQMVVTQDYIILADIAFKIEFSQLFSPLTLGPIEQWLDQLVKFLNKIILLRKAQIALLKGRLEIGYYLYSVFLKLLPSPQITNFYIISRADLRKCNNNPGGALSSKSSKSLHVRKFTIPREVSHFTADYSNPDGKIALHIGHQNGTDVTEWISKYEKPVKGKEKWFGEDLEQCKRLAGMMTGAMDVSSFGRYIIDGETGAFLNSKVFSDPEHTWWPSVYAHREICRDSPSEEMTEIENIYWTCNGFSWEIIPDRIYQAYKDREFRVVHYTQLPEDGKPCKLLRLDAKNLEIVDWFDFPIGHFACSPQFIPKSSPCPPHQHPSTHGYIACVVLSDAPDQNAGTQNPVPQDEFWIFDANNLGNRKYNDDGNLTAGLNALRDQAIIYKLSLTQSLNMGLTIHSIWLSPQDFDHRSHSFSDLEKRQGLRQRAFYRDYGALIESYSSDHTPEDWPRKLKKSDKLTTALFQEIQQSFIEQWSEDSLSTLGKESKESSY